MNITVSVEFNKDSITNFTDLENACYKFALSAGREVMKQILCAMDDEIAMSRDRVRYRNKGLRNTCIKSVLGEVEFERRVYIDNEAATETPHCVHLLDEALGIEKTGLFSPCVCELITKSICESSYRAVGRQITDMTGQRISAQGVWNVVQQIGERQANRISRYTELANANQGLGTIITKLIYEENDGIWLKLQGISRKENGVSKEMKLGIAYDGVLWTQDKKRKILDNKLAYAGFMSAKEFQSGKEGIIANAYDIDEIELRVINGDGAGWVQGFGKGEDTLLTLDVYHRNKKIYECIRNSEFRETVKSLLYAGKYDNLIEVIDAQINSVEDEEEKNLLGEIRRYYFNNKEYLSSYYDRGREIPETRDPGRVHHASLGGMESNVFTLIGNRMKGKRRSWSIKGANNLAQILCAAHTVGMEDLFAPLPAGPIADKSNDDLTEEELAFINAPIPYIKNTSGSGNEYSHNVSTTNCYPWLKNITAFTSLSELSLKF